VVLLKQRRFAEARSYFETAIQLKPDFAEAHSNFGATLHAEGRVDEAIAWYTKALALAPGNADVEYNLGRALISRGDIDAALAHYHRALAMNPDDPVTHVSLGSALASRRQFDEAIVHYRRALELTPSLPAALVDLAWVFATSDRTDIRSPQEAIRLAERGVEVTERRSPTALDTLAVAYAAAGDFRRATTVAEEALLVATATGASELAEQIRNRLYVYRQRR
jgi:tetratricopeptide (TPR) repeat protein